MSDPFQEALDAEETTAGPFRTAEPTRDKRLERARDASFQRVRQTTALAMQEERRRERRMQRGFVLGLVMSLLASGAAVGLAALGHEAFLAWTCPAFAATISFALLAWKYGALTEAWSRGRPPLHEAPPAGAREAPMNRD